VPSAFFNPEFQMTNIFSIKKLQEVTKILGLFAIALSFAIACGNYAEKPSVQPSSLQPPQCRVIKHPIGESCVPFNLDKPVALGDLDNLLALGIKPIGAALWSGFTGFPDYLGDRTEGIAFLGTESEPNLEKIAYLQPDIILGYQQAHGAISSHLAYIAPTVLKRNPEVGDEFWWKKELTFNAEVFGKQEVAEQLLDDYGKRIENFQQQMGEELKNTKVSVVRFFPDSMRIYLKDSFIGGILQDVGLSRPPAQDREGIFQDVSPELISLLDGDVIFVMNRDPVVKQTVGTSTLTRLKRSALWSKLKAVQRDRVYEVSETVWVAGGGGIGVNLILDDLFRYLQVKAEGRGQRAEGGIRNEG